MIPDECPGGGPPRLLRGAAACTDTTTTTTGRSSRTCTPPRCHCGPAAELKQSRGGAGLAGAAGGGGSGGFLLLADIQTPIVREPFTDHYSILPGRELGRGKFAVVRKCVEKRTGREYAAKFMRKRRKGQDCRSEIVHEVAVLELARASERVVNLHQVYEMASEMVLVLEFAAGGEIYFQCVAERGEEEALSEAEVKRLMRQILEGVAFLHRNDVVHLDLKPQNILLTSDAPVGDIKIVDFGLSRMVNSHKELREIMGTPEYVAPEILNYEPISTATDMWSVGVLAYVMLTGVSPFLGESKQETFLNISQLNVSYADEELQHLDHHALAFMQALLRKRPQERATAEQCLRHPWLQLQVQEEEGVASTSTTTTTTTTTTTAPELQEAAASAASTSVLLLHPHDSPEEEESLIPPAIGEEEEEDDEEEENEDEDDKAAAHEELMVVAAYTTLHGQCRQQTSSSSSSSSEKEVLAAAAVVAAAAAASSSSSQKAVSKRFKFEEPFVGGGAALQEILPLPAVGEFIC